MAATTNIARNSSVVADDAAAALSSDELSDRLEQSINQKLHGAYYTPAAITAHLCDRTIHRAVLDAVARTSGPTFDDVPQMFAAMNDATASLLLDKVLPHLSVLDPTCGAGAFLVAATETIVSLYRQLFAWIDRAGDESLRQRVASLKSEIARRVLADNIFGVDLMPEAVDVARQRLSLRADDEASGLKLNLVAGNSLIGLLDAPSEMTSASCDAQLLQQFRDLGIRYERSTWNTTINSPGAPERRAIVLDDIARLRPLHWPLAFADVMARGGFDVVVTNPPWDVFKPNGKEFFKAHSELVTKKSMSIHAFEAEQERLLGDAEIRDLWLDYRSAFPHQSAFFRTAPEYRHQTSVAAGRRVGSDLNLYKLFTERCYRLLRVGGHCGLVVPSGIYTDLGAKGLREWLFNEATIESLFSMENREGVFEGVHRSFKFVVLQFARGGRTKEFPAAFMRRDVGELARFPASAAVAIDIELIRKLSPDSLSVTEFKSEVDLAIARKMSRFPLLGEAVAGRWRLRLSREFDMTNHGRLFQTSPAPGRLPLFEGKMIWQFDDAYAEPRYWVDEREGRSALSSTGYRRPRFAIRAVASNVNVRTLIAAIVPANHFCGNSLLVDGNGLSEAESLYLAGVMNSFVLDWLVRQKVTTNINMFQVYQLPVPRLMAGEEAFDAIVDKVVALARADASARFALRAEIEAIVARLYGLDAAEFAHVLDAFPLVDAAERGRARSSLATILV